MDHVEWNSKNNVYALIVSVERPVKGHTDLKVLDYDQARRLQVLGLPWKGNICGRLTQKEIAIK